MIELTPHFRTRDASERPPRRALARVSRSDGGTQLRKSGLIPRSRTGARYPRSTFLSATLLGALLAGCSRSGGPFFSPRYANRQAQLHAIALAPPAMQIESLHSGGLREPRPDLENDVRARLIAELTDLLRRSGREIAAAPADAPTNSSTSPAAPRLAAEADARALLAAVHEAIVTHHVRYRHRRELDYAVGDAARTLCDAEFDAALVASLQAAVPTGGRSALQAAGLAMSAVTQSFVYVPTHEAALTLMLIDADGEVLWFGFAAGAVDVLSDSGLRRLVRAAGRRLLHEEK